MTSLFRTALLVPLLITPGAAHAQADAGITIAGLISLQPVNDSWIGSPYLDEGIGGARPGVALGANLITANGFAVIGEFSTTTMFEQRQVGRLVWANRSNFSHEGTATTRLRDTLMSGLAGYAASTATQRVILSGGISYVHTTLRQDELDVEEQVGEFGLGGQRRFALTGGVEWLHRWSPRVAVLVAARYSWLGRPEVADQTGAGEHLVRLAAGLRLRLNP